jgi:hypothetical protein
MFDENFIEAQLCKDSQKAVLPSDTLLTEPVMLCLQFSLNHREIFTSQHFQYVPCSGNNLTSKFSVHTLLQPAFTVVTVAIIPVLFNFKTGLL